MKIHYLTKRRQGGMAVIVMLAVLSIMCIYIAANLRSLNRLERELKLVEQHQTRRLAAWSATNHVISTNTPPATQPPPSPTIHE